MAESTLSATRPELLRAIGMVLGWDPTPANWTAGQTTEGNDLVAAAEREFYMAHDWSFLHITTTLATVAADYDYTLPDTFGQIESEFTFAVGIGLGPVRETNDARIRELRAYNNSESHPQFFAVRPIAATMTDGQRWEAIMWPTPSAVWTLGYQYRIHPGKVTAALPYPHGGMIHSQTLLALCEAVAEENLQDESGLRRQRAMRMLAQSIQWDQKNVSPRSLGYVGDPGMQDGVLPAQDRADHSATYAGTAY